jgi:S-adenosylmethionine-dependent methyltransferase
VEQDAVATRRPDLVLQSLIDTLGQVAPRGGAARVLDCGGGSGGVAVPLAQAGAQVTVVDASADALATLVRRAAEAGVAERVTAVQGDVEDLDADAPATTYDLVLAHGILEVVENRAAAFAGIAAAVRPGGRLSVLVGNPTAGVLTRAVAGDLAGALADLRTLDADFTRPGPDSVQVLCREHGLLLQAVHGIGLFRELVPGPSLDAPGAQAALDALEAESAPRRTFAAIAPRVHVLAYRPGG